MEALNRGHGINNNNGGRADDTTSPHRLPAGYNGGPQTNTTYGMQVQNESAFARSPLQVNRQPNIQSSYYVKQ